MQDHDECYQHPIRNHRDLITAFEQCKVKSTKNSIRAFHSVSDTFIQDTIDAAEDLEDLRWAAKAGNPLSFNISLCSHELCTRMGFINGAFGAERETRDLLCQTRAAAHASQAKLVFDMNMVRDTEVRRGVAFGMLAVFVTSTLFEFFHQRHDWQVRVLALAASSLLLFAAIRLGQYLRERRW